VTDADFDRVRVFVMLRVMVRELLVDPSPGPVDGCAVEPTLLVLDRVRDFVMDLVGEGATAPKLRDGELEAVGLPGPGPAPVREPEGVLDTVREPEPAPPPPRR
jgi:hypothetical protein